MARSKEKAALPQIHHCSCHRFRADPDAKCLAELALADCWTTWRQHHYRGHKASIAFHYGWRKEKAADEETLFLLKQLSFNPDIEKAKAAFGQAPSIEIRRPRT